VGKRVARGYLHDFLTSGYLNLGKIRITNTNLFLKKRISKKRGKRIS
jgi:hypothetical protein